VNVVTKFGHNGNRSKVHSEQLELVACITLADGMYMYWYALATSNTWFAHNTR